MMRRGLVLGAVALAACQLTGCANAVRADSAAEPLPASAWSGRLAVDVADAPSQSFSALFELQGNAAAGSLLLTTPIGSTIARLVWMPGSATLENGGATRRFASLDAMVAEATGTPLPVAALFDWLAGTASPVPGWQPDLAQHAQGRLRATRHTPQPVVELRAVFDRG